MLQHQQRMMMIISSRLMVQLLFMMLAFCTSVVRAGAWTETDYVSLDCTGIGVNTVVNENQHGNGCHDANGAIVNMLFRNQCLSIV